jgi:NAD(P)-dependent dehydrogenase (short-subunit alcohol dehydrogenase family)
MSEAKDLAVVVGAGGSMGAVITERLAAAGLDVLAIGRSEGPLRALEGRVRGISLCLADIARDSAIDAIRAAVGDRRVRMAVHAAGLPASAMGGVLEASTEGTAEAFEIKVGGMMRLVRAVDARLGRGARLVAIAGHYGLEPGAHSANPGVANAALINLMRQLSMACGKRGVSAHVIAPGPTDTERLGRAIARRAASRGVSIEALRDEIRSESPMNAIATCNQVAWAVTLLLAPEAEVLTGSTLALDYGRRRGLP